MKSCYKIKIYFYFLPFILILSLPSYPQQRQKITNPFPQVSEGSINRCDYNLLTGESDFIPNSGTFLYRNNIDKQNTSPTIPVPESTSISRKTITMSWAGPSESDQANGANEGITYNIYLKKLNGNFIRTPLSDLLSSKREIPVSGNSSYLKEAKISLADDGDYAWGVQAIDNSFDASTFSQGQSFHIEIPPEQPSVLTADSGNHLVELKWRKNQEKDISKYYIYYSTSLQSPVKKDSTGSYTDTVFIVRNLHNNVKYYFWISAVDNNHNESKLSLPVSSSPYKIPTLTFTEISLNFPNIAVGDSAQIILYAINNTPDPVLISSILTFNSVFKVTAIPETLLPDDSLKIKVVFNPKSFGNYISELNIYTMIDTLSIPLKGSSGFPEIFANMSKLNFLYTAKDSTRWITLGISNNSVNKLDIDSIFTQTRNFYPRIPETVVPPKNFLYIPIYFSPDSIGSFSDTLIFINNSQTPVLKIPLIGNSKLAELGLNRTSINFDSAALGSGKLQKMTFYNLSENILEISSIKNSLKFFNISTNLPQYINGHDSLIIDAQFYPAYPGVFNDTTHIVTNGGDTVLFFNAVCPLPQINISSDTLDFGNTIIDSSAQKQIFILNSSISYLKIDSIEFSNSYFRGKDITTPFYVQNKQPHLINIGFHPDSSGIFYDSLKIFNSSPQSPFKILLIGKGEFLTGVRDYSNKIPDEFSLSQNYPNPFNPTTTISYTVPKSSFVTIKLYDILGKEVATLVNEEKEDGTYNFSLDGSKLSSGIYFYTMQAEDFVSTRKLILLK